MTEPGAPLFPVPPKRHRIHRGLVTERQEYIFHWIAVVIVLLYVTAWIGALVEAHRMQREPVFGVEPAQLPPAETPVKTFATQIFGPPKPATPFLNEAALGLLESFQGESGEVRFAPVLPGDSVGRELAAALSQMTTPIADLSVITLVPASKKRGGRIGSYMLGNWPENAKYAAPSGFIEVTLKNRDLQVSEHFRLRDFLTKDQPNVWPKYLLLDPKLIDKLELTIQELEAAGVRVEHVQVMSGFRTPRYNHSGGNTAGRANLSRHMYGDAADVFVDNDRNGIEDDLNRDGRVDARDADVVGRAAERVERKYPSLVGGIGVYSPCCGHGPFTHMDVRGFRARWRGTGNG